MELYTYNRRKSKTILLSYLAKRAFVTPTFVTFSEEALKTRNTDEKILIAVFLILYHLLKIYFIYHRIHPSVSFNGL